MLGKKPHSDKRTWLRVRRTWATFLTSLRSLHAMSIAKHRKTRPAMNLVDALELDQSFVHDIIAGSDDDIVVSAVINMGKSLKQRVIAEGVETLEQLAFLQAHGCDEGQGYYFSRPVVAPQLAKLLETGISASA